MYYTGIHPMTGKKVQVTTDYHEKQLQRALLQYSKPDNANLVREALRLAGREDLIGNGPDCLVRPSFAGGRFIPEQTKGKNGSAKKKSSSKTRRAPTPAGALGIGYFASTKKKGKSKFDRIFGEDADRIRREADKMTRKPTSAKKQEKSAKNMIKKKKR
jgi:hypothetical protein